MRSSLRQFVVQTVARLALALVALATLAFVALGIGPRTGLYQTATVLTGSMRPHMPQGSVVVTTPVAARDVRVGDVISYHIPVEDHRVVTHRVVQILEGGDHPVLRTKGDANDAPDPWVARMDGGPVWKVRAAFPKLGFAIHALRRPLVQRMCVMVVPLVLCVVWLRDIWFPRPRRTFA